MAGTTTDRRPDHDRPDHDRPDDDAAGLTPREWWSVARRTAHLEKRTYEGQARTVTAARVAGNLWPRLRRPIFVVGAPRSGTSFLGECVGAAPSVGYHYEPIATKTAARFVYDGDWSRWFAARFYRATYRWLQRSHGDGDLRFAEKTPRNSFIAPFLAETFPDAQFVHIIRDGRDAAVSHREKPWLRADSAGSGRRESGGYDLGPTPRFWVEPQRRDEFRRTSDIHRCIWAWRRHVTATLLAGDELEDDRYLEVRYERLVTDPRGVGGEVLDFLDLGAARDRDPAMAAFETAQADSVGRWREVLDDVEVATVQREAGDLLDRLGYSA